MSQKNLAIFDSEMKYAKRLMEMLSERKEIPFRVYAFTTLESLQEFAVKQGVDYLLIEEAQPQEVRSRIGAGRVFVLSGSQCGDLGKGEISLCKYQSVEEMVENILEKGKVQREEQIYEKRRGEGRLIGVYSPIHRIGKSKFARELGRKFAKEEPTLYLNLEEYAGRNLPKGEHQQGLSNLLYYAKQENTNLGIRLSGMVYQRGQLDCVAPIVIAQDIRTVTAGEWLDLFQQIFDKSVYETIVLDLGESVQGLYEILDACHTVYTPYINHQPEKSKLSQYVENLHTLGLERILEHTVQKQMKEER